MRRLFFLASVLFAAVAWAQREWVDLERAQARLALAREELQRVEALAAQGLVAEAELSRKQAELRLAELDYRDALWQFQGSRLRVVVADSVRATGLDGLDTITLLLELPPLGALRGAGPAPEAQLGVADLQVSLVDKGVVVGYPYAKVVPYLSPGEKVQVAFQLLRPVETPTVALEYRSSRHEITLYPRVARSEVPFRVTVAQPSLAVVFGEEARFQLTFEPLQPQSLTLDLAVQKLPGVCTTSFRERQSGAAVSSLRLGAGSGAKDVELVVKLPPGPVPEVRLDVALVFSVVARFSVDGRQGEATQELRITPVGVPRLALRTASWLLEITKGDEVTVPIEALNEGSAPAREVGLRIEAPAELLVRAEPSQVEQVAVGEKAVFGLSVKATKNALPGEYTLRLQPRVANRSLAQGEAEGQLRVRVHSSRAWLWPVALALLLIGVAVVAFRTLRKVRLD